jgi:hypothetical protein
MQWFNKIQDNSSENKFVHQFDNIYIYSIAVCGIGNKIV